MVCICDVSLLLMQSLFMFTTQAGFAAGLPVIHISGTHYQVGYQVVGTSIDTTSGVHTFFKGVANSSSALQWLEKKIKYLTLLPKM